MITLETNQPLATDPDWAVVEGGTFNETELVECYRISAPEQRVAWYALFISTGEFA